MTQSPAIEAVLSAIRSRLAAVTPSVDPATPFVAEQDGVDVRTLPAAACDRHWAVRFERLRPPYDDPGVQTPGVTDRRARFLVEIAYPVQARLGSLFQRMSSDAELFSRALGRSANWAGTPVRWVEVDWTREDQAAGATVVAVGKAFVQYRDVE